MQELIEKFIESGLTHEQAQTSLQAISEWLQENYPVAGALIASWMKTNASRRSG